MNYKYTADRKYEAYPNSNYEMPDQEKIDAVNNFYNDQIENKSLIDTFETTFDLYINVLINNIYLEIANPDKTSPIQLQINKSDDLYNQALLAENTLKISVGKIKGYNLSNLEKLLNLEDFYSSIGLIENEMNKIYELIQKIKDPENIIIYKMQGDIDNIIKEMNNYITLISSLIFKQMRTNIYIKKIQEIADKIIMIKLSDVISPIYLKIEESNKLYDPVILAENKLYNSLNEINKYYYLYSLKNFYSSVNDLQNKIKMIKDYKKYIDGVTYLITVDIKDYQNTLSSLIDTEKDVLKNIVTIQKNADIIITEGHGFLFMFSFISSIIIIILFILFCIIMYYS